MKRFYLSEVVGTGAEEDPYRPAVLDHGSAREFIEVGERMLVWIDESNPKHARHDDLIADPRVMYVPFEDNKGNPLPAPATLSQISPTNRATIRDWLEARNVPIGDLTGADTIATLLRRVIKRYRLRCVLWADDVTEALDLTLADIPVAKRQRINDRLTELGYDTSFATGSMLIRDFLRLLGDQDEAFTYLGAE